MVTGMALLTHLKDQIWSWILSLFHSNRLSYWWTSATAFFSTLSLQDYVFVLGAIFSAYMTWRTYKANIREKAEKKAEEQKRTAEYQKQTAIIEAFLKEQGSRNLSNVEAVSAIGNAVRKADHYTAPDAPVGVKK